jgi:glutaredoxin 3
MKATNVKLYSTRTCPYCTMEKEWLDSEKIKHEVIYVDSNYEEAQAMVEKTGQMGVPVTEIKFENGKEEYVVGFNKQLLSHLLNV